MRLLTTCISLLFSLSLLSQNNFTSVQNGNWNDASTWTLGGGPGGVEGVDYPSSSDIVIIDHNVIIDATNNGTNFTFIGNLTINANDTLESQVGNADFGFVLEGNGVMTNNGSFFVIDASESPDENAKIPYEFVCRGNSIFIGGVNSFAFIADDWIVDGNAQIFIDNLNCYAVSDDVNFEGPNGNMYGEGNIRIGGDGPNSTVNFNGGASAAQLDDDITIWRNSAALTCGFPGTVVTTGTNNTASPPFAFDDTYSTALNTSQNQSVLTQGLNTDFSPITGDVVTITSAGSNAGATNGSTTEGGTVTVNNNGTPANPNDDYIVYTPPLGFLGTDTYNYLITNNGGGTDIAEVTVIITDCGSNAIADTSFTNIINTLNSSGVGLESNLIGAPNGDTATWYTGGDIVNVDFGQIFTAGTRYIITWRARAGNTNAQPVIRESTTNGSFTTLVTPYIIASNAIQTTTITSENDFQFLQITKVNGVNATDFEIDAIQVIEVACLSDNDGDGIDDESDIDDDNDGIKDGDENNCTTPEAYWTFDNTTDDATLNNHDERTTGNPPSFSTDAIQGSHSANFNGTTQRIRYSQDGGFMEVEGDTFSFSVWIKPTNLTGIRVLFEEGGGTNGWIVYLENGVAKVATRVGGAGSQTTVSSNTTLTVDNKWHHIAGTFNLGVITVWVDGVSNSNTAGFTFLPPHGSDGTVGGVTDDNPLDVDDSNDGFYAGLMDGAKYSNFEVWDASQIGYSCDSDGDNVIDQFDLDADNDGIADIVEAGGEDVNGDGKVDDVTGRSLTSDTDNDGLDDRYDFSVTGNQLILIDTDGDGLFNGVDLDSDNDGIPDIVEEGGTDENGDGRADNYSDIDEDGFNDVLDGDVGNDGVVENSANALVLTGEDTNGDGLPNTISDADKDGDGIINRLDLDADNDGIPDVIEQGGTDVNGDGRADNFVDSDKDGFNDRVDGDPTNSLTIGSDAAGTNSSNSLCATGPDTDNDGQPNSTPNGNIDQDGVYNFLDLDADGDGILDVVEAGGTDTNTDGVEDAFLDADGDGFNDAVDGDPTNVIGLGQDTLGANSSNATTLSGVDADLNGKPDSYPNDDFDTDGKLNFLDIDADNDGITDNTEGQPTTVALGYVAPANADADGDGIDDNYDNDDASFGGAGSGYALQDNDAAFDANSPDYLDLDSDNDGYLDEVEGHDTDNDGTGDGASPANTGLAGGTADIDNDGLLDGFDNNTASSDATNNNLTGESHTNVDNNATIERDWREALDTDLDGFPDFIDIDDDNDGILDEDETPTFCTSPDVSFVNTLDAYWSFDNNTNDISGNNNNQNTGTVVPTYSDTAVQGTHSARFNGGNQKVRYSQDNGTNFMEEGYTEISFSAWIIPYSLTGNRVIYEEGGTVHGSILWLNGNILTYSTRTSGSQVNVAHQTSLVLDGGWHHVAATYNNGVMTVYLDGVPSTLTPANGTSIPPHSSDGGVGGDFGNNSTGGVAVQGFAGLIDAARYSNSEAWTSSSIALEGMQECLGDADGDGVPNNLDLDSDNDGIADIIEAGGVDTNGDGRVDDATDTDNDGWADTFDPDDGGVVLVDGNQDGDRLENRIDLDSDNDGIADIVEAGGEDVNEDGRADNFTDANFNGWSNTFDSEEAGTSLLIVDTDGDGLENYLDLDSDSDGIIDNIEGQTTAAFQIPLGTDTDNDGWDDRYDSDDGGTAIVLSNNNGSGPADYLDQDSDGDGQPDWMERADDDEDGDALLDLIVLANAYESANANPNHYVATDDADNDEIPDFLEDADADGIPNFLDPDNATFFRDSDSDGIIDFYDADQNGDSRDNVTQLGELDNDGAPDFRDNDNNVSLPIELVRFTATKVGDNVQLDWTTATEINNDYFTIERSADGELFEPILTEGGAGTSSKMLHYRRIDSETLDGYNYYRLKQTDFNGESKEFNIEVVKFEKVSSNSSKYNVYPNPTTGRQLFLEIDQPTAGEYQFEIMSSVGKLLDQRSFQIESETIYFEQEMLRRLNLAKGVYFLRIQVNGELEVFKFIVQ